jgi:chromosome segregation ATPase
VLLISSVGAVLTIAGMINRGFTNQTVALASERGDRVASNAEVKALTRRIDELEHQLAASEKSIETLNARIVLLEAQLTDTGTLLSQSREEVKRLNDRVEKLEAKLLDTEVKLRTAEGEAQKSDTLVNDLKNQIVLLNTDLEKERDSNVRLTAENVELAKRVAALEIEVKELNAQLSLRMDVVEKKTRDTDEMLAAQKLTGDGTPP